MFGDCHTFQVELEMYGAESKRCSFGQMADREANGCLRLFPNWLPSYSKSQPVMVCAAPGARCVAFGESVGFLPSGKMKATVGDSGGFRKYSFESLDKKRFAIVFHFWQRSRDIVTL